MKKQKMIAYTIGTLMVFLQLSCTGSGKTENTGASSDTPASFGTTPPSSSGGTRGTNSAAEMDSIRGASKDTAETVGKGNQK